MPAITAAHIRFQDYQFSLQLATGTWRWTTRVDVSGSTPSYQIRDVTTPYGTLRDKIPLPGDVVVGMAESITQLQANFPPSILMGPPPSLTFEVDEGRGFSAQQSVVVTNDGVYGSILGAALGTSATYVSVTPDTIGGLASNETGTFLVAVDSTDLLASDSPYAETITVTDSAAQNSPVTFSVTINVRAKATIDTNVSTLGFSAVRPLSGAFAAVPTQAFVIENTGPAGSVLSYQVQKLTGLSDAWLNIFSPVMGDLESGDTQSVSVTVVPMEGMASGTYQETLRVSGYSTNEFVDVLIQLVIS